MKKSHIIAIVIIAVAIAAILSTVADSSTFFLQYCRGSSQQDLPCCREVSEGETAGIQPTG